MNQNENRPNYQKPNSVGDEPFGCLVFLLLVLMVVMFVSMYLFSDWYFKYKGETRQQYTTEKTDR